MTKIMQQLNFSSNNNISSYYDGSAFEIEPYAAKKKYL